MAAGSDADGTGAAGAGVTGAAGAGVTGAGVTGAAGAGVTGAEGAGATGAEGAGAAGAGAAGRIRALGSEGASWVIERRRHYHAWPELGNQEFATTDTIASDLASLGIASQRPCATGLVATIRGGAPDAYDAAGHPHRRLLMRADIDALPVTEETGLAFSSQNPGVMHACGHDCHIAMLLGAARILAQIADELHGEVRLVFQPDEERSSGSSAMIDAGVLDGVDAAFAEHVWSDVDAGTVSVEAGPRMAAVDWWRIDVSGRGAHAAMPEAGADAIVAAAAIVSGLQTLVSRESSPFEPVVITTGTIAGGTARNVIADAAVLEGTVRCFSAETRARLAHRMASLAADVAHAYGCAATLTFLENGHGAVVNDADVSAIAEHAAREVLGADAISRYAGSMPGEDFARYLERVAGALAFVGSGTSDPEGHVWPQHSSHYSPDEGALLRGTLLAAQFAVDFLAE